MKHLKKFESGSWGFDIELVKDIILDIKAEYPDITGEFHHNENSNGGTLKLFCKPDILKPWDTSIIGNYDYTLDYIKNKNKFISSLTEVCDRISKAINREVKVIGLYEFDKPSSDGYINIHIMHK